MLLDDLGDLLSSAGVGTVGSTGDYGIFKGFMPAEPDKAIAIHETGGVEPYRKMHSTTGDVVAERPRVQVMVRSTLYSTGRQKIQDAWNALEGLGGRTINSTRYLYAEAVQSPFLIGRDENSREMFAFNLDVVKELSTA